jgi:hypothetical protein
MAFPVNDKCWTDTASFLEAHVHKLEPIIAPNAFLDKFPGTYPPQCLYAVKNIVDFRWAVIHKRKIKEINYDFLERITKDFVPVFANEIFVVFSSHSNLPKLPITCQHLNSFMKKMKMLRKNDNLTKKHNEKYASSNKVLWCGIVVTTYNRPSALERSLPQITRLGAPVLVVDDGSNEDCYEWNSHITQKCGVSLLRIPVNRGLPCAINMGISYWLADPKIEWISCFQDDVDVHPTLLTAMAHIQDAELRPLCTGHDASEHLPYKKEKIGDHLVLAKWSSPGIHLHAHRDYLRKVIPIPTPYLGAPKRNRGIPGQGSDEDWWIATWAPSSVTKRGMYVACVPGLVDTFLSKPNESTWGGGKPAFKRARLRRLKNYIKRSPRLRWVIYKIKDNLYLMP